MEPVLATVDDQAPFEYLKNVRPDQVAFEYSIFERTFGVEKVFQPDWKSNVWADANEKPRNANKKNIAKGIRNLNISDGL